MTPYERRNPECLSTSRKARIVKGSGRSLQEVNRLITQFDQMRKMMHAVQQNGLRATMKGQKKKKRR